MSGGRNSHQVCERKRDRDCQVAGVGHQHVCRGESWIETPMGFTGVRYEDDHISWLAVFGCTHHLFWANSYLNFKHAEGRAGLRRIVLLVIHVFCGMWLFVQTPLETPNHPKSQIFSEALQIANPSIRNSQKFY